MKEKNILLVEDNPDDVKLTIHAFKKCGIANPMVIVHDGAAALDYLFSTGAHAGRDPTELPTVVLLDLKLPKIDGLDVLRRLRADSRTRRLPVLLYGSAFWKEIVDFEALARHGMISPADLSLIRYVDTVDEAFAHLVENLPVEPEPATPAFASSTNVDAENGNGRMSGSTPSTFG